MKIKEETKIEIIETNIEGLKMGEEEALIIIDDKTFDLGMDYLLEHERYEDCCIMRDNKDNFVMNHININ